MNLQTLIHECGNSVTISVTPADLKEFGLSLIAETMASQKQEPEPKEETYLSVDEASQKLGCTPITLWRWDKIGLLPKIKIGRTVRYRLSDIERLIGGK